MAELAKEANFGVFFKLIIPSNSHVEPEDQSVESSIVLGEVAKQTVGRPQWGEPSQELLSPIVSHSMV